MLNLIYSVKFLPITPKKLNSYLQSFKGRSLETLLLKKDIQNSKKNDFFNKGLLNIKNRLSLNEDLSKIILDEIIVMRGPILKRIFARAKGKAFKVEKILSHLTLKFIKI